jgi:hypothetical protein
MSATNSLRSGSGLYANLQALGCPLLDDPQWTETSNARVCVSPDGTAVAISWLPCMWGEEMALPGTCGICVSGKTEQEQREASS